MVEPLVIERSYAAAPGRVWEAWTRDEQVAQWYCPNPGLATTARLEVRPGGRHEVDMGEGFALRGVYSDVVMETALAHTWAFNGGHETHVDIRFAGDGQGGTRVRLTHDGFEDDEEREGIAHGWRITLDRLHDMLSGTRVMPPA